jgi:hypothetical protein
LRRVALLWLVCGACGCGRASLPGGGVEPAALGRCAGAFDAAAACGAWDEATASCQGDAAVHDSFPELDASACYVPVHYRRGRLPRAGEAPTGCGYPRDPGLARRALLRSATRFERAASHDDDLPQVLACDLPAADRAAAARVNARTLRRLAERVAQPSASAYPYALVGTFGFGHGAHDRSSLVDWRPGDACVELDAREMRLLSINRQRVGRAVAAYFGGVAPVVSFSGSAVHSSFYEAFMHHYLAVCVFGVPNDAVLLDPCADHTHTNVRNSGSLVIALAGRTAYLVTDDGIQSDYLQESTAFDPIGGSIDARALRDWGYLLGSWRQASVGIDAGFWYTPYRFWGEPAAGLGSFSCVTRRPALR